MANIISRLHLPLRKPEDVIPHLGKPTHWKQGRSAKALADTWHAANGIPPRVRAVLNQAPELIGATLVDSWLERANDLEDDRGSPSQTDLLAVLSAAKKLVILGIEAKVTESFGPTVSDWLADGGKGKVDRLKGLCDRLSLDPDVVADQRYQLLHRTVATILEAGRYRTNEAVVAVQSFCPSASGLADFIRFFEKLGFNGLGRDQISAPREISGISLRAAWVSDDVPEGHARQHRSVEWLTDFGRTRLSKNFFMRDFLFSDIASVHGLSNIPDDPELAVAAGRRLCEDLLEPLQDAFGRIAIRSAYRSQEVNGFSTTWMTADAV